MATRYANPGDIMAVLEKSSPGDIVHLRPGDYELVKMRGLDFGEAGIDLKANPSTVKIRSMEIADCRGIRLDGGTITAMDRYGNALRGYGVRVHKSADIALLGGRYSAAVKCAVITHSQRVLLEGAVMRDVVGDGVIASYNEDLSLRYNVISDFEDDLWGGRLAERYHQDGIQAYANGRLVLDGNRIAGKCQGLTDFGGKTDPRNQDVLAVNNIVVVEHPHTITLTSSDGVRYGNNIGWNPMAGNSTIKVREDAIDLGGNWWPKLGPMPVSGDLEGEMGDASQPLLAEIAGLRVLLGSREDLISKLEDVLAEREGEVQQYRGAVASYLAGLDGLQLAMGRG